MPPDSPLIGRTLSGRFTVTSKIGEGGFSKVYRGVQAAGFEPRDVAIKVMNPELTRDRKFVRRFRREAKAAVRLNHPSSVRLIEYGVDGECVFIVMELLVGTDLFETLVRERRLSPARAVRILMQVCEALAAAHEHGVIHRDLKPENIMLLPDPSALGGERVKVLDFGIAKILDPASDEDQVRPVDPDADDAPSSTRSALTRAGTVMGTPAYMSPEQGRAEPVDARTDLYACGVLLYQLVTGRVPFDGETALQIVMQHVHNKPTPPSEIVPGLDPSLEALILKCLSKWPTQRQQSAMDLRAELGALLPTLPDGARAPGPASPAARLPSPAAASSQTERGLAPAETIVDEPPVEITTVDSGDDDDDGGATLVRDPGPPPPRPLTTPARRHLVPTPTPLFVQTAGVLGALQAQVTPIGSGNTPTGVGTTPLPIPTPTVTTPGVSPVPPAQPPRVVVTAPGPASSPSPKPAAPPPRSTSATTQRSMGAVGAPAGAARAGLPTPKPLPAAGRPALPPRADGARVAAPLAAAAPSPVPPAAAKQLGAAGAREPSAAATPAPAAAKPGGAPAAPAAGPAAQAGGAPQRVRIAGLLSLANPTTARRPPSVRPPPPTADAPPPPRPAPPRPPPPRRSAPPAPVATPVAAPPPGALVPPSAHAAHAAHADGAAVLEVLDLALAPTELGLDLAPTEVALPEDVSPSIDVVSDDVETPLAPAVAHAERSPAPAEALADLAGSRRSVPPLGASAPGPVRASVPPDRLSAPPALPTLDAVAPAAAAALAASDVAHGSEGRPSTPGPLPIDLDRLVPLDPGSATPPLESAVAELREADGASVPAMRVSVTGLAPAAPPPSAPAPRVPASPLPALVSSPRPPAVAERGPRLAPPVAMAIGIAIGVLGCGVLVVLAVLLTR